MNFYTCCILKVHTCAVLQLNTTAFSITSNHRLKILLIATMALWQHASYGRPVVEIIADMSTQSHCGDDENI